MDTYSQNVRRGDKQLEILVRKDCRTSRENHSTHSNTLFALKEKYEESLKVKLALTGGEYFGWFIPS